MSLTTARLPATQNPDTGAVVVAQPVCNPDGTNIAGGGGGGGGAVTVADGADVAQGTTTDAAYAGGASMTLIGGIKGLYGRLVAILAALGSPLQAGGTVQPAGTKYVTVAAGATQTLGTGAIGDLLNSVTIIPGTTSPGVVQIKDSAGGTAITIFAGGATSVGSLVPFTVYLGAKSTAGGWSVICGTNVTAIGVGSFT